MSSSRRDRPNRRHPAAALRAAVASIALTGVSACAHVPAPRQAATPPPAPETPTAVVYRGDPFLADVSARTFEYFWRTTDPATGLTPDRTPSSSISSIAAIGFALTAYPIGVAEGYVSRADAAARTRNTLRFLYDFPKGPGDTGIAGYKGFFYHYL